MGLLQQSRNGTTWIRARLVAVALACLFQCGIGNADTAELLERAEAFARQAAEHAYPTGTVSVRVVPLDPRLRLEPCTDLALDIPGERVAGRVAVQARCRAPVNWGLYLTAQVDVVIPVVQVARPIPRDSLLRPADVILVPHNLAGIRDGYLIDPADAVGLAAKANLRADSVLYQRQLAAPRLVSKGDTVTLASSQGPVHVSTQAIALTDGVYGEQVEVRNPRSRRVLTAWVTGPGRVSTHP
ncbi:MAG: flagellar basal body P-ring formation chaperone FlgA [Pseudomonadales bacterium]